MAEKEYIERDEAYKTINEAMTAGMVDIYSLHQRKADFEEALEVIKQLPSADVQEVVRCKSCQYYDMQNCYCEMFDFDTPSDDFYCREGEKMDGDTNV